MPFFLRKNAPEQSTIGIWKIEEPIRYFEEKLNLFPAEKALTDSLSARKQMEWLASRWTLHLISGHRDRGACLYDPYGKPFIEGSDLEISMSHSHDFIAVMAGRKPVGIDIQKIVPKIYRLKHKFLSEREQAIASGENEIETLHVMWGAKECLFKAYGKGQLPFATNIGLDPFFYGHKGGHLKGKVEKDAYFRRFDIAYRTIEDYMLVFAVEADGRHAPDGADHRIQRVF